jgi:hypothetical protein
MHEDEGPPWKGKSEGDDASLQAAIEDAWDKAKGHHAAAGKYVVDRIEIETSNPIHAYIVIINPSD